MKKDRTASVRTEQVAKLRRHSLNANHRATASIHRLIIVISLHPLPRSQGGYEVSEEYRKNRICFLHRPLKI